MNVPDVPIAFFDLDDTLIDRDTNSLWVRWRAKKSVKGILELLYGLAMYFYYKKGKLTAGKMNAFFWFRTIFMTADKYSEMCDQFFNENGINHFYKEAINIVENHRKKGVHIVMITGQDDYLSRPFFRYLKFAGHIANERIVKDSRFIGIKKPNCYGEGKIELAMEYARKHGVFLKDCSAFSDSIADLPFLKSVRYPIAVNPDPELLKVAKEMNWPIITYN